MRFMSVKQGMMEEEANNNAVRDFNSIINFFVYVHLLSVSTYIIMD